MNAILAVAFSGIVAAIVMALALFVINKTRITNADMIRAVGSLVTRREEGSLGVGFIMHLIAGIVFAFLYVWIWSIFGFDGMMEYWLLGLSFGFAHGLIVSMLLVIFVAEHHPLERFQRAGMGVALAHLLVHVVYGFVVGTLVGVFNIKYNIVHTIGQMMGTRGG